MVQGVCYQRNFFLVKLFLSERKRFAGDVIYSSPDHFTSIYYWDGLGPKGGVHPSLGI